MKKLFIGMITIMVLIVSCKKDKKTDPPPPSNNNNNNPPSCKVVQWDKTIIDTAVTWKAGNVYVIPDNGVTVKEGGLLTIEAGVIVKFKSYGLTTSGNGTIKAEGTASAPIIFTSYKDDKYCGDSNGDGTATSAGKGDWIGIYLNGGSNHIFKYVKILYAGKSDGGYTTAVNISIAGTSFTFDHCIFAHTLSQTSVPYAFNGGSYMQDPTVSVLTNNAFYDNGRPLYVHAKYEVATNNIFHNPDSTSQTNKGNGIYMWIGDLGGSVTWGVTEVPYVLNGYLELDAPEFLDVKDNVVVKFMNTSGQITVGVGTANFASTAAFTSFKDDARGGDSNGDGNTTSPTAGDWEGICDEPTDGSAGCNWRSAGVYYSTN